MELKRVSLALLGAQIVMLMTATFSQVRGMIFLTSENKLLPAGDVNRTQKATRRCDCRMECHDDPNCTAFSSVAQASPDSVLCMYSYSYLFLEDLEDAEETQEAWTFMKTLRCPESYVFVSGSGCVILLGESTFTAAAATCPNGALLASPPNDAAFRHLAQYIKDNILIPSGQKKLFVYVGVERVNGVWTWRDGHVTSSEPGTSLWVASDPNDDTDCALMLFNLDAKYHGSLADNACSAKARVMCSLV
ncbi:C-type lectin-like [Trinorchestia longiramus]|nr:C-type lectin-like [Trinorchestia longiramus]